MNTPLKIVLWIVSTAVVFIFLRKRMPAYRAAVAMQRSASFSFVFFKNDVTAEIPKLLESCRYKVLEKTGARKTLGDLYANLPEPAGPKNSIVTKAFCSIGNYTVLCDPEMVFLTFEDEVARFCRKYLTEAVIAVWERFSETVALGQISADGLTRQTFYIRGKATSEQKKPHQAIQDRPNSDGLRRALDELGIPVSKLNDEVEATVVKLQE